MNQSFKVTHGRIGPVGILLAASEIVEVAGLDILDDVDPSLAHPWEQKFKASDVVIATVATSQ